MLYYLVRMFNFLIKRGSMNGALVNFCGKIFYFFFKNVLVLGLFVWTFQAVAHPWHSPDTWASAQIIETLKKAPVIHQISMKEALDSQNKTVEFEGDVSLVTLEGGIKAVFKSVSPEDIADAHGEVAAFKASRVLGFPDVPPTVMRTISGKRGSLQLYVETSIDLLAKDAYEKALDEVPQEDQDRLRVFYFVFGQWDSGPHNLLLRREAKKTHLIAIDNAAIGNLQFVRYGELPFVRMVYSQALQTKDWHKPFPFDQARILKDPSANRLKHIFGKKLPESFYAKVRIYGNRLKYVVYQNAVWRQFHAFDEGFVKAYVPRISPSIKLALEKLDKKTLEIIFQDAKGMNFFTKSYLNAILERRDQVLNH